MVPVSALRALVEQHCSFNCDAESSCECHAHRFYRDALLATAQTPAQEKVTASESQGEPARHGLMPLPEAVAPSAPAGIFCAHCEETIQFCPLCGKSEWRAPERAPDPQATPAQEGTEHDG
jgi:hypothetical protein